VTDAEGERDLAPAASDAVDIGAADTTALDLDVDVVFFKGLGFELIVVRNLCSLCCHAPTSCFLNVVQSFVDSIMNPSKESG
jgi:hypothetical protein